MLAVAFAGVSLAVTGFRLDSNNVFHIPYVLGLAAAPEFEGDAFYGSLKYFASVVWPLVRLVTTEANLPEVFAAAHVASRVLSFAALAFLLRVNAVSSIPQLATALAVLAITPWLMGASQVGVHDLFHDFFTHTALTWPLVFVALAWLQRRHLVACAAATGVAFSVNAFVGLWLAAIVGAVLAAERTSWRLPRLAKAGAVFLLCASPALVWIAVALAPGGPPAEPAAGRYIDFIRLYFPQHFLIEAAGASSLAALASLYAVGFLAARHLPAARFWTLVQGACLLLFLVGIPLPYLAPDNRLIFNLHLLRSDGLEQALAVILAAAAAIRLLGRGDAIGRIAGVTVLLLLCVADRGIEPLAIALALAAALVRSPRIARALLVGVFAAAVAAAIFQVARAHASHRAATLAGLVAAGGVLAVLSLLRQRRTLVAGVLAAALTTSAATAAQRLRAADNVPPQLENWRELTEAIRRSDARGPFLVPLAGPRSGESWLNWFALDARRPSWVDWKQGAAAMWYPPFQAQWMQRITEVGTLESPEDFIAYARAHGLENVVVNHGEGRCPFPSQAAYVTPHYTWCRLLPSEDAR